MDAPVCKSADSWIPSFTTAATCTSFAYVPGTILFLPSLRIDLCRLIYNTLWIMFSGSVVCVFSSRHTVYGYGVRTALH